jgi:hypothetical protein
MIIEEIANCTLLYALFIGGSKPIILKMNSSIVGTSYREFFEIQEMTNE